MPTSRELARAALAAAVARVIDARRERMPADLLAWRAGQMPVDRFVSVPDGVMIAFYPAQELARQIALPDGEPPEELHVTLALPGKLSDLSPEQRRRLPQIVRGFGLISRPLAGKFSGVTEFPAFEGVKPVVLLVDVPGLPAWRQRLVEVLALNGFDVANDHGFIPHLTLKYAPEGEAVALDVPTMPLAFDRVCLVMGDRKREYPLGGNPDVDDALDAFALDKRRVLGRKQRPAVEAVNRYQVRLVSDYESWADDLAASLAEAEEDDYDELIAAALLALLLLLKRRGTEHLPDAVTLALARAGGTQTVAILQRLADAIARNDGYLTDSLLPAIGERLREMLASGEWAAMQLEPVSALTDWVMGWLTTFAGRVALYAGAWWTLNQDVFGVASDGKPLQAFLDPQARHCEDCPRFHSETGEEYSSYENYLGATGGRKPGEFACAGNCRCFLDFGDGEIAEADDLPA